MQNTQDACGYLLCDWIYEFMNECIIAKWVSFFSFVFQMSTLTQLRYYIEGLISVMYRE